MSENATPKVRSRRPMRTHSPEFKKEVVERAKELDNVAAATREKDVCASQIRDWMKAYEAQGLEGLKPKSTRPHKQPRKTAKWITDKILKLKGERPEIGSEATSQHLERFESITLSAATIGKLFKKHKLPDGDAGHAEARHKIRGDEDRNLEKIVEAETGEWERFSRPHPNNLWQMDLKDFYIRGAHKVYLISALDDCSRFIVNFGLFRDAKADNVLEVLRGALAKHGAPDEILTDQGSQFTTWNGVTQFEKLLAKLKIKHVKARSHHPQTCGKIEAFHKTLHRELLDKEFFFSQEDAAEKISRYIEHYNYARPHSSLEGFTPADRYFQVIDAVKKYLAATARPTEGEDTRAEDAVRLGSAAKLYLVGRFLGKEVRLQEVAGRISLHLDGKLCQELNFHA